MSKKRKSPAGKAGRKVCLWSDDHTQSDKEKSSDRIALYHGIEGQPVQYHAFVDRVDASSALIKLAIAAAPYLQASGAKRIADAVGGLAGAVVDVQFQLLTPTGLAVFGAHRKPHTADKLIYSIRRIRVSRSGAVRLFAAMPSEAAMQRYSSAYDMGVAHHVH